RLYGRGHRLDLGRVELAELLHPGEDVLELADHLVEVGIGNLDAGQRGDLRHGGSVQRHGLCLAGKGRGNYHPPMPIRNPTEIRADLTTGQRLMGLDLGEKTIGLALSDTTLAIASPLETLRRGKIGADAEALRRLVAKHGVGGLVLGLPVNMDGSEG